MQALMWPLAYRCSSTSPQQERTSVGKVLASLPTRAAVKYVKYARAQNIDAGRQKVCWVLNNPSLPAPPSYGGRLVPIILTLMTALVFLCVLSASVVSAKQPSWGWNDRGANPSTPPATSRRQSNDRDDLGNSWFEPSANDGAQQDAWASQSASDQYPYGEDEYGYAPSPPPLPDGQGWGGDGDDGQRDSVTTDTGKRRNRKRGHSGVGRTGINGEGFDEDAGRGTDLVEEYTRTVKGRLVLSAGSSVAGAALAAIISKSTIQQTPLLSLGGLMVGLILSVAKGAFGDLFRALGLASILAVRRSRRLSAEYPFLPYARRALAMRPRRPFPPAENPWKYKKSEALAEMEEAGVVDDSNLPAEFSMAKALLSSAFLGAFAGYIVSQFIILPTFLLALGGGGFLAYLATTKNARGDLTRLIGMRTVAFLGLVAEIDADVALSTKARVAGGICFSKAMFWDSKYHIKDRIVVLLTNLYAALVKLVGRVQRDAADGSDDDDFDFDIDGTMGAGEAFSGEGRRKQDQQPRSSRRRRSRVSDIDVVEPPIPSSRPPPPPSGFEGAGGEKGGGAYGGGGRGDFQY